MNRFKQLLAALFVSLAVAVPIKASAAFNAHGDVNPQHHGWTQFPIEVLSTRADAITGATHSFG